MVGNKKFVAACGTVNIDQLFSGMPRVPQDGEELFSKGYSLQMGGGVPGTIINVSRLGVPVRLQTALGTDYFSQMAEEVFKTANVEMINLTEGTNKIPMNLSIAIITSEDRTFVSYTDGFEVTDEIKEIVYQNSTGAAICQMDLRFLDVYKKLHEEGTTLILDTGWDDDMCIEKYRPFLEIADYYTPNQKEAMKMTGAATPQEAAHILSQFFKRVIVKLDSNGCLIEENGVQKIIPIIPEYAGLHKDSTGAGDAFLSGFIYGIYHDATLEECVLYGNLMGGKCVTEVGALTAYYTEEELLEKAKKYHYLIEE